jgi:hypothetical protein
VNISVKDAADQSAMMIAPSKFILIEKTRKEGYIECAVPATYNPKY